MRSELADLPLSGISGSTASPGPPSRRVRSRTLLFLITVGSVALALGVSVVALDQLLDAETELEVDRRLNRIADNFAAGITDLLPPAVTEPAPADIEQALAEFVAAEPSQDQLTITGLIQGVTVAQNGQASPVDLQPSVDGVLRSAERTLREATVPSGRYRLLAAPITVGDKRLGALLIVEDLTAADAVTRRTIRDAVIVGALTLLVVGGSAWLAIRYVVGPIEAVARTAAQTGAYDLNERLPQRGTRETVQLIDSFNAMVGRLETTLLQQRQFLDDASHELRTPLTIMRGHLDLIHEHPGTADESYEIVIDELERMGRIVDDLLVLAHAEEVTFLHMAPTDCDDLVVGTVSRMREVSDHAWTVAEVPIGVIDADAARMTQAMLNLATNAARHTAPGGLIEIGGQLDADVLRLWVRDEGDGIEPHEQEQIFERFVRASSTRRSSVGGAGLGLTIVRAIVEAHDGRVFLDSAPGEGTTVTIEIPVTR